ncbi:MAG TPA: tetratricopeptide repeat protein [Kofleriaceae bacterium]|jgi:hypothetical protein
MRPARSNLIVIVVLSLIASLSATRAWADTRDDARAHYQSGLKLYTGGDYKAAITEFSAAQQLMPADLNNYNIALCYDKLGDADNAVKYYRDYLAKVPDAPKRAEIEASINRLSSASASASKKAADEKAAADAKTAADAKAAQDAQAAADAAKTPKTGPAEEAPADGSTPPPDTSLSGGSTGTPSTGQAVQTGDAQLDRVAAINIDQIRDQRLGPQAAAAGAAGPATNGPPPPNGAPNGAVASGAANQPLPEQPQKETPLYKKWWFWAVVAVSAYVVYEIATQSSSNSASGREEVLPGNTVHGNAAAAAPSGLTLLRF